MPVTMTTTAMSVTTRTPRTFAAVAHCEHHSHPPAALKDIDVYHDNIRQLEAKLQAQYDVLHHGDDEESDEDDDDAVEDASGAVPPDEDVTPTGGRRDNGY